MNFSHGSGLVQLISEETGEFPILMAFLKICRKFRRQNFQVCAFYRYSLRT